MRAVNTSYLDPIPPVLPPATEKPQRFSPRWGATTKLIVGLSLVAIIAFLFFRFLNIIGPLLMAFILAYLLYPMAERASRLLHISWRFSVTVLYLILLILLIGSIAIGGLAVIDQVQNLINFLQTAVQGLPDFINDITSHPVQIGPFVLNFELLDVNAITQQLLGAVQPLLSSAGTSVVSVASGAASFIGWMFFIVLISYFMMAESDGLRLISFSLPGYAEDFHRLGIELNRIWNAFLRGQITIVLLTVLIYTILLGSFGVNFYFGLALLAGLARFIPYVGPFIAWTSYGLVAFFQGSTIFGIPPLGYVGLVVGTAWLMDMVLDNFVTPRMMSNALKVHPAAVMISALVAFNLLGVIGMVLAAPVLATVKLFFDYVFAKLFDLDPWKGMEINPPPLALSTLMTQAQERYEGLRKHVSRTWPISK